VFLFVWGLVFQVSLEASGTEASWYVSLDIILTFLLTIEVIVRIIATHKTYWKSWLNWLDFCAMLYAIISLFLYLAHPESTIPKRVILAARYLAQLARVYITVKEVKDRNKIVTAAEELTIDFDSIEQREHQKKLPNSSSSVKVFSSRGSVNGLVNGLVSGAFAPSPTVSNSASSSNSARGSMSTPAHPNGNENGMEIHGTNTTPHTETNPNSRPISSDSLAEAPNQIDIGPIEDPMESNDGSDAPASFALALAPVPRTVSDAIALALANPRGSASHSPHSHSPPVD